MEDRTPTKPGRVLITPESGVPYYAVLTMADEPTQEGTPPTKANLLNDFACKLVGVETTSVPSDAFCKLALGTGKYGYGVTVLFNGSLLANAAVTGISTINGSGTLVTDESGLAVGVSTSSTVSITVTPREINLSPKTISVTATGDPVTNTTFNIDEIAAGTIVTVGASRMLSFTSDVTAADFCLVGAGGGGGTSTTNTTTSGGGGGSTVNALNVAVTTAEITATIGAGGSGATSNYGGTGGSTAVTVNGQTYTATGGRGGSNSGGTGTSDNGGAGGYSNTGGGNATVYKFGEAALGYAGGGGGGSMGDMAAGRIGGNPYGGNGNIYGAGYPGTGIGGGGGSAKYTTQTYAGGAGYHGGVYVRWRKS